MKRAFVFRQVLLFVLLLCGGSHSHLAAQVFKSGKIFYNVIDEDAKHVAVTYDESNCSYLEDSFGEPFCNDYSGFLSIPATVIYNGVLYRVTSIGYRALANCKDLTSVKLPPSITSIHDGAFINCKALKSIELLGTVPPFIDEYDDVFAQVTFSSAEVVVPNGCRGIYSQAEGWRYFANIVTAGGKLMGDVNGDNKVDVVDAMCIVSHILNKTPDVFFVDCADINADGKIDVVDVMKVIDKILIH